MRPRNAGSSFSTDRFSLDGPSIVLDPRVHAWRKDIADVALAGQLFAPHYAQPLIRDCGLLPTPVRSEPSDTALRAGAGRRRQDRPHARRWRADRKWARTRPRCAASRHVPRRGGDCPSAKWRAAAKADRRRSGSERSAPPRCGSARADRQVRSLRHSRRGDRAGNIPRPIRQSDRRPRTFRPAAARKRLPPCRTVRHGPGWAAARNRGSAAAHNAVRTAARRVQHRQCPCATR